MRTKTTLSAIGGWHSFLFCVGMYFVALFFSIFVCSSVFYIVNSKTAAKDTYVEKAAATRTELASVSH